MSETYTPDPRLLTPQEVADVKFRAQWLVEWFGRLEGITNGKVGSLALMHAQAILDVAERAGVRK